MARSVFVASAGILLAEEVGRGQSAADLQVLEPPTPRAPND